MNEPEEKNISRAAGHEPAPTVPSEETTVPSEELSWLAFRYVLNELSQSEAAAFESQLTDDETACLAVARATQLAAAMQVSCEEFHRERSLATNPESKRTQERDELVERLRARVQSEREKAVSIRRPLRVFAIAISGCVILIAAVTTYFQTPSTGRLSSDRSGRDDQPTLRLAEDAAAENLLGLYGAEDASGGLAPATFGPGSDEMDLTDSDSGIAVPDWLLTAVELDDADSRQSMGNQSDSAPDDEHFDDSTDSSLDESPDQSSGKSEVL